MRTSPLRDESRSDDDIDVTAAPATTRWERIGFPAGFAPGRESLVVVGVVGVVLTVLFKLWNAHWKVPWSYNGDGTATAAYTKAILTNGWYLSNPRLAAPFTADWRDFPLGGENLHWLALKLIGFVTRDYGVTINLYYVFGFFLVALAAYYVVRYLQFGRAVALVAAGAFTFLPYHVYRNEAHFSRGVYFTVPMAVLVILWMMNMREEFFHANEGGLVLRRGRLAFALVTGFLLGGSDTQNAAYMMAIIGVIALVVAIRDRDWRPLAILAALAVVTFGSLLANNLPYTLARMERGPNNVAGARPLNDQDFYALRPMNLVLPAPGHRVPALRHLADKANTEKITNSETPGTSLGILGAIGFVWSIGAVIALGFGWRPRNRETAFVGQLGTMNVVAVLLGMIGGVASLLALAGFTQYRTWNRISLFIAFGSMLAVAVLLSRLFGWIRARLSARGVVATIVIAALAFVLVAAAAYDQSTPPYLPNYKYVATRFDLDATFYHGLEKTVPARSMIYQLPFEPFPEAGSINKMEDYEDLKGYLHTKNLRFNYGGIKGRREGDWQTNLSTSDPATLYATLAAIGFQGVVVDRSGYADNGEEVLADAAPFTGAPLLRSPDDRLLYLDLSQLRARLQQQLGADKMKEGADIALGDHVRYTNFSYPEAACGTGRRWAINDAAFIDIDNPAKHPVTMNFSTAFEANPQAAGIDVHGPGFADHVTLDAGTGSYQKTITLKPGKNTLRFDLDGPSIAAPAGDSRPLSFGLVRPTFGPGYDSPIAAWAHALDPACKSG